MAQIRGPTNRPTLPSPKPVLLQNAKVILSLLFPVVYFNVVRLGGGEAEVMTSLSLTYTIKFSQNALQGCDTPHLPEVWL